MKEKLNRPGLLLLVACGDQSPELQRAGALHLVTTTEKNKDPGM